MRVHGMMETDARPAIWSRKRGGLRLIISRKGGMLLTKAWRPRRPPVRVARLATDHVGEGDWYTDLGSVARDAATKWVGGKQMTWPNVTSIRLAGPSTGPGVNAMTLSRWSPVTKLGRRPPLSQESVTSPPAVGSVIECYMSPSGGLTVFAICRKMVSGKRRCPTRSARLSYWLMSENVGGSHGLGRMRCRFWLFTRCVPLYQSPPTRRQGHEVQSRSRNSSGWGCVTRETEGENEANPTLAGSDRLLLPNKGASTAQPAEMRWAFGLDATDKT
ncbi:uncharacterized protein LY79DRAFT_103903 [Colletotrichum navitas]|uniref:Uncharacterized protein n=1 Tax=Colletotrichum navitas TaxID=681940 RepID=A0AAD8PK37_9PEZI|nr:uncharacterized protein LY79DRAFT_103903 [Colletotrichum navitas]KAK1566213.1 hypothetical protein LY79DRAFT_103903 [Colletotrichum navitas]